MESAKKSELDDSLVLFPCKSPERGCFMLRSMSQSSEEDAQMENRSKTGSAGCAAAGPVP